MLIGTFPATLLVSPKLEPDTLKAPCCGGGRSPSQVVSRAPPSALYCVADVSPVATVSTATIHAIDDDPLHRLQLQRGRGKGEGQLVLVDKDQQDTQATQIAHRPSTVPFFQPAVYCFFIDNRLLWPFDNFDLVSCGCSMLTTQRPRGLSACSTSNVDVLHQRPHPVLPTTRFVWPIAFLPVPDCLN